MFLANNFPNKKTKQNLNNFKIKVYYSAELLCQGTHNVVVVFANVVVVIVFCLWCKEKRECLC